MKKPTFIATRDNSIRIVAAVKSITRDERTELMDLIKKITIAGSFNVVVVFPREVVIEQVCFGDLLRVHEFINKFGGRLAFVVENESVYSCMRTVGLTEGVAAFPSRQQAVSWVSDPPQAELVCQEPAEIISIQQAGVFILRINGFFGETSKDRFTEEMRTASESGLSLLISIRSGFQVSQAGFVYIFYAIQDFRVERKLAFVSIDDKDSIKLSNPTSLLVASQAFSSESKALEVISREK